MQTQHRASELDAARRAGTELGPNDTPATPAATQPDTTHGVGPWVAPGAGYEHPQDADNLRRSPVLAAVGAAEEAPTAAPPAAPKRAPIRLKRGQIPTFLRNLETGRHNRVVEDRLERSTEASIEASKASAAESHAKRLHTEAEAATKRGDETAARSYYAELLQAAQTKAGVPVGDMAEILNTPSNVLKGEVDRYTQLFRDANTADEADADDEDDAARESRLARRQDGEVVSKARTALERARESLTTFRRKGAIVEEQMTNGDWVESTPERAANAQRRARELEASFNAALRRYEAAHGAWAEDGEAGEDPVAGFFESED
jgi:hypothetical protein